jgi:hypothetical protein
VDRYSRSSGVSALDEKRLFATQPGVPAPHFWRAFAFSKPLGCRSRRCRPRNSIGLTRGELNIDRFIEGNDDVGLVLGRYSGTGRKGREVPTARA